MVKHVFIVTYGRTGSTLLMNVLNGIDGVLICGETGNYIYNLWRIIKVLDRWREIEGSDVPTHPFYGHRSFPFERRRSEILSLITEYFDSWPREHPSDLRGFKEVRYIVPDFLDYIDFLDETFEESLFICLTRDEDQCVNSGFYEQYHEDDVRNAIAKARGDFRALAERKPGSTYEIDVSAHPGAGWGYPYSVLRIAA